MSLLFLILECSLEYSLLWEASFYLHTLTSSLTGQKSAEIKRLNTLGFHVLDLKEEGEVEFHEGQRVLVRRGADSMKFKKKYAVPGTISVVNVVDIKDEVMEEGNEPILPICSGVYDVKYDDGSTETNVSWRHIQDLKKSTWGRDGKMKYREYKDGEFVDVWKDGSGPWTKAMITSVLPNDVYEIEYIANDDADKAVEEQMAQIAARNRKLATKRDESSDIDLDINLDILNLGSGIKASVNLMKRCKRLYDDFYPPCKVRAQLRGAGPFREAMMFSIDESKGLCTIGHRRANLKGSWEAPDVNFVASWSADSDILSVERMLRGSIIIGQLIEGENILPGTRIDEFITGDGEKGEYRLSTPQTSDGHSIEVTAGLTLLTISAITAGALEEGLMLVGKGIQADTIIYCLDYGDNGEPVGYVGSFCQLSKFQSFSSLETPLEGYEIERNVPLSRVFHVPNPAVFTIAAKALTAIISPKEGLIYKTAVSDNIFEKPGTLEDQVARPVNTFKLKERTAIIQSLVNRLNGCEFFKENMWLVHNNESRPSSCSDLDTMAAYYGSTITMYFGWCSFYTWCLIFPASLGLYTFYLEFVAPSSSIIAFFALFNGIWCTFFLKLWKRHRSVLAYKWGTFHHDQQEMDLSIYKTVGEKPKNGFLSRLVSVFVITCLLVFLIYIMIIFIDLQDHSEEIYGTYSLMRYYPMVMYSCIPSFYSMFFGFIVNMLIEFEDHTSDIVKENHRIYMKFALHFTNRFCMLFYVAFYLHDIGRLRRTLTSLLIVGQISESFMDLLPILKAYFFSNKSDRQRHYSNDKMNLNIHDIHKDNFDLEAHYLKLLVQFGYVAMFSAVFPLIPLLACINNYFESKVDFMKLQISRRPLLDQRSNLGAWMHCLHFVSFSAIGTNSYLLAVVFKNYIVYFPEEYHEFLQTKFGSFCIFTLISHTLYHIKQIILRMVKNEPAWLRKQLITDAAKEEKREHLEDVNFLFKNLKDGEQGMENMKARRKQHEDLEEKIWAGLREEPQKFELTPLNVIGLCIYPIVLEYLGVKWQGFLILFFVAGIYLTYQQVKKNRADRHTSLSITSDPELIKYVVGQMPPWVDDGEFQRVEWFNRIMKKLWPHISDAMEQRMKDKLQPTFTRILERKGLDHIASITLDEFSLGDISPKIKSIRVYDNKGTNYVRYDVDWTWAGNPLTIINLGLGSIVELPIEISDFRMNMNMRFSLNDLCANKLPFRSVSITCMKAPFVDLSCKLGVINITDIGLGNLNVRELMHMLISESINSMLLFPNIYDISMTNEKIEPSEVVPVGLLQLTVLNARNLNETWLWTSDPYVEIFSGGTIMGKTQVIYKNLNPVWDEEFNILVYDKPTQKIRLNILHHEVIKPATELGYYTLSTDDIPIEKIEYKTFDLRGGQNSEQKGKLSVKFRYLRLAKTTDLNNDTQDESFLQSEEFKYLEEDVLSYLEHKYDGTKIDYKSTKRYQENLRRQENKNDDNVNESSSSHYDALKITPGVFTLSEISCKGLYPMEGLLGMLTKNSIRVAIKFQVVRNIDDDKDEYTPWRKESSSNVRKAGPISGKSEPLFHERLNWVLPGDIENYNLEVTIIEMTTPFQENILGTTVLTLSELLQDKQTTQGKAISVEYAVHGTDLYSKTLKRHDEELVKATKKLAEASIHDREHARNVRKSMKMHGDHQNSGARLKIALKSNFFMVASEI